MIKRLLRSDQPGVRVSDADRDRAAQTLRSALTEGRITVEELETRLDGVNTAVFEADLRRSLAELPSDELVTLRTGAGGLKRTGDWLVPARLQVKGMGAVVLDFRKTAIPHPIVQIELKLGAGSVTLLLPGGATADVDGLVATMGSVKSDVTAKPREGATHFVLRGHTRMGSVGVHRRRGFAGFASDALVSRR